VSGGNDVVVVTAAGLTLEDVRRVAVEHARVELAGEVVDLLRRSRAVVDGVIEGDELVYGLNTLLGHLRDTRVSPERLAGYQLRMIDGHDAGIGAPLADEDVRAAMVARVAGAARGGAGLHPGAVDVLVAMLNAGVHPVVAEHGSVGAADLMHMAAIAAVVVGHGRARLGGEVLEGAAALARAGIAPHVPQPKDGLALVSANGVAIGLGALTALRAERAARMADTVTALSLEAVGGNPSPFGAEVVAAKALPGQVAAAAQVRALLAGSRLLEPTAARSVQDPLSFRVAPQVSGAFREQAAAARHAVETELNAAADSPFVSIAQGRLISNGNFQPVVLALAFDALRGGLAHVAMLSERRMNKHMALSFRDPEVSLALETIPVRPGDDQTPRRTLVLYAAASVLAELKQLAAPVTIHSPPLDLDVEDHGTVAPAAIALTRRALDGLELMLACEALMAADTLTGADAAAGLGTGTGALFAALQDGWRDEAPASPAEAVATARRVLTARSA